MLLVKRGTIPCDPTRAMPAFRPFKRLRRITAHRRTGLVIAGIAMAAGVTILAMLLFYGTILLETIQDTEILAEELTETTNAQFADVSDLSAGELQRMRTYLNKEHIQKAKALGVSSPPTRQAAVTLAEQDKLAALDATDLYYVQPMDYSVPYVTKDMANLLTLVGLRFREALREEGLPPYRYVITSGTRSEEDQKNLRRTNSNAVPESSHQFGTTVDIHYGKFVYAESQDTLPDSLLTSERRFSESMLSDRLATAYSNLGQAHHEKLKAILGRVLLDLQGDGQVLIIHEQRQPVYHITVGSRIDEAEPEALAAILRSAAEAPPDSLKTQDQGAAAMPPADDAESASSRP